jgi:hypothetical protein
VKWWSIGIGINLDFSIIDKLSNFIIIEQNNLISKKDLLIATNFINFIFKLIFIVDQNTSSRPLLTPQMGWILLFKASQHSIHHESKKFILLNIEEWTDRSDLFHSGAANTSAQQEAPSGLRRSLDLGNSRPPMLVL